MLALAINSIAAPVMHEQITTNVTSVFDRGVAGNAKSAFQLLPPRSDGAAILRGTKVKATKNDVKTKFGDGAIRNACKQICDGHLDDWFVADNQDPYPDDAPSDSYIIAHPESTQWSGLNNPQTSHNSACYTCENSHNSGPMTCTPTLQVTEGTTMSHSTTTTAGFSQSFKVEVEIPEVFKVTSETTFSVSSSDTSTMTDSKSSQTGIHGDIPVPAHKDKCAQVEMTQVNYDTEWTMPVSLEGGFRCDYGDRCNGHYFWYGNFESFLGSSKMQGTARAQTHTTGSLSASDGACPSTCGE